MRISRIIEWLFWGLWLAVLFISTFLLKNDILCVCLAGWTALNNKIPRSCHCHRREGTNESCSEIKMLCFEKNTAPLMPNSFQLIVKWFISTVQFRGFKSESAICNSVWDLIFVAKLLEATYRLLLSKQLDIFWKLFCFMFHNHLRK